MYFLKIYYRSIVVNHASGSKILLLSVWMYTEMSTSNTKYLFSVLV